MNDSVCHIGLGSNIGDASQNLVTALAALDKADHIEVDACSGFYSSVAWGNKEQPGFVNAVARVHTHLEPQALLEQLLSIEFNMGRKRDSVRWGPRLIDLDFLLAQELVISSPQLCVPHPLMHKRAFVLLPLLEIEPDCIIPGRGPAYDCLSALPDMELKGVIALESGAQRLPGSHNP